MNNSNSNTPPATIFELSLKEFIDTYQQERNTKKCGLPSMHNRKLGVELISEEFDELMSAYSLNDSSMVLDALADLLYVVSWNFVACGFPMVEAFEEVHRSNMSKLWTYNEIISKLNISDDDRHILTEDNIVVSYLHLYPHQERSYLVRKTNGKVVKSPSYSPANFKQVIAEHAEKLNKKQSKV